MRASVYVPCYNGEAWLAECLDALLGQTRQFDELIVVDDGSTDSSAAIARGFGPRVRLVQHERNRGLAVARNTALAEATGDVVASVDADVRASPAWLAHLLSGFDSPRTAAAGGKLIEACQDRLADRWRAAHMAQHSGDFPLHNPPALPGANVAVRRDVIRALGGYSEAFRTNYEDVDLQHRWEAVGYRSSYVPSAVAYHLRTDTASSVLRTYWSWLRPLFERQGAFRDWTGLKAKLAANAEFARRALWQDFSGGAPALAYLSLLVLLAFPAADLAHAARLAWAAGDQAKARRLVFAARVWLERLPRALVNRSPALAGTIGEDVAQVQWWVWLEAPPSAPTDEPQAEIAALLCDLQYEIESLPRAWWPAVEDARARLAEEETWV
ncbi:MAG: glycosyltransferase family 2 protein [Chloroflexi bacterium]|nr:glycosyltransferase family 2 protein [Chloroflexota bacterium]